MRDTMRTKTVPLLFTSDPIFIEAIEKNDTLRNFRPEDVTALRDTYLPFWGPYWIAGKIVSAADDNSPREILVPGPYSLTGADIKVDGRRVRQGDVISLARGVHRFSAVEKRAARLTWGDHLRAPPFPAPRRPYRVAF
jgi:hypothetical protein